MKRKEEKILARIRDKVIERDRERNTEKEIKEMREANIEALTELTSLSRTEVENIADQVKNDFLIDERKRRKQIILWSLLGASLIFVLYLILKPAPEIKSRTVTDNFNDNSGEWSKINSFVYNRYFKKGTYTVESNHEGWCYWDGFNVNFPKNCDIEVSSTWVNGKYNSYGIGLNQSDTEYFAFTMSGNGTASFGKVIDGKWAIDDGWKYNIGNSGKNQTNIQRIEIRNKNFNYYVNDKLVRTGTLDLDYKSINLYYCGEQEVAYDYIKIINSDSKKVEFSDDFSNPSNLWTPKKNYTCISFFEEGKYIFDVNNNENCHWSTSDKYNITDNCEVELTSIWQTGELANFGLMILNTDDNYYSCEYQNNGDARLVECLSDEYTYIQPSVKTAFESTGKDPIIQKAIIKSNELSYYVNGELIKTMTTQLKFPCFVSLRGCGKQKIAFDKLSIKYYE